MTLRQGFITAIFFYLMVFAFGEGLRQFGLFLSRGQCEVPFMCLCRSIGEGICDGNHDYNGLRGK